METKKTDSPSGGVIEILTLTLKPGTRDQFHRLYVSESLPLLKKWNMRVVAHGPSLHDENGYFVIRHFKSVEDRQKEEDAFYGSEAWRKGPREAILAMIEHDSYIVVSPAVMQGWLDHLGQAAGIS